MMTRPTYLLIFAVFCLTLSCSYDFGKVTVTYTKATPTYGDMETLRALPLVAPVRPISNHGKVYIGEDLLLIGEEGEGIHVFDNSQPESPQPLYFLQIPYNREFYVHEQTLYAESSYDMLKVDLSSVQSPTLEKRIVEGVYQELKDESGQTLIGFEFEEVTEQMSANEAKELDLGGLNVLYYDYASRLIPPSTVPSSFAGNGSDIGTVNRIAYAKEHVYMVTRSYLYVYEDLGDFKRIDDAFGSYVTSGTETIYPKGDQLFIGAQNSLQVFNIDDPCCPFREATYFHMTSCDPALPVNDEIVYLSLRTGEFAECPGDENELDVLRVRNGAIDQLLQIPMESPYGMTIIDQRLYVGEGENGFAVFNIEDPEMPVLLNRERSVKAYDIIAHPTRSDHILVAGPEGFSQYRIGADQELHLLSNL